MKTVHAIMSPIVYCLDENTFLPEAAKALRDRGISGAPVINAEKQYVGVISQTDINAKFAKCMEDENSFKAGWVEGRVPSLESVMVKDIMTREVLRISADASLEELGKSLLVGGVHRLLVVDEGEVVGPLLSMYCCDDGVRVRICFSWHACDLVSSRLEWLTLRFSILFL